MADNGNAPGNGQGGQGGGSNTPADGGQGGAGAGGASGGTGSPWFGAVDDLTKGYIENKGWGGVADVVKSYQGVEKLIGVPKEQLVRLPQKADDPAWGEVYGRLGRPEKPDGYEVPVPDFNGSKEFASWAQKNFHELGLSKRQGDMLAKNWNEFVSTTNKAGQDIASARDKEQLEALKTEWGNEFQTRTDTVKKVGRALGINEEQYALLEMALGVDGAAKTMFGIVEKFGVNLGDGGPLNTGSGNGNGFHGYTPAGAAERINSLSQDKEFAARLASKDQAAVDEWTKLHRAAYPGESM